ncbi:MAG: DUF5667 domain-containing protein [Candidatus Saccharimonadales bacterium]
MVKTKRARKHLAKHAGHTDSHGSYLFDGGPVATDYIRPHYWIWYSVGVLVLLLILVWGMAVKANGPNSPGYTIKLTGERVKTLLTFGSDAKTNQQAAYAAERVQEATLLAKQIPNESQNAQIVDTQTMQDLLTDYIHTTATYITNLSQNINEDSSAKVPDQAFSDDLKRTTKVYEMLVELRLSAPSEAQATVLQATSVLQTSIATLQDALRAAPVTTRDSDQLAQLVSQGFLTRSELTKLLASATSNRQLLDTLRGMVKSGQLPATVVYAINYDLVRQYDPHGADRFVASINFDELRKVAIFNKVALPTPEQKQAVQAYLANYKAGMPLPRDAANRAYIMPLIYGLNMTPGVIKDLRYIDPNDLSPVRRVMYDAWKPLIDSDGDDSTKQLYADMLQLTDTAVARNVALMKRVQLEVLKAVRSNVAYLALPPGWTNGQVVAVEADFAQQITDLQALETTQAKAQTALDSVTSMTTPLITPLTQSRVDLIRQTTEQQMSQLQQKLIITANSATDPNTLVPDIGQQLATIQNQFNSQIAALGPTHGAVASQVSQLQFAVKTALTSGAAAQIKLKDYVQNSAGLQTSFLAALRTAQAGQSQAATGLRDQLSRLAPAAQAPFTTTAQRITALISQNAAALQQQLGDARTIGIGAQTNLQLNLIARSNQITLLQNKLKLLDTPKETATNSHPIQTAAATSRGFSAASASPSITPASSETNADRTRLQQLIEALQDDQIATKQQIQDGIQLLTAQLHQAISGVIAAQPQTAVDLAGFNDSTDDAQDSLSDIYTTQITMRQQLRSQAQSNIDLGHNLQQSIAQTQQAVTTTQAQIDQLNTGVEHLKTNVSTIANAQTTAQTQINQLLATSLNWARLPATLQFNQDQFQRYQQQLTDDFTAKAAILQQQFEAYKKQLDGQIQQLRTDTNGQIQQLKDEQATIKAQLQQALDQINKLQKSSTGASSSP